MIHNNNHIKRVTKIVTFYEDGTFTESVPYQGYMPSIPMNPNPNVFPNYNLSKCTKCGMTVDTTKAFNYCCPAGDCPMGMGPIQCGVTNA